MNDAINVPIQGIIKGFKFYVGIAALVYYNIAHCPHKAIMLALWIISAARIELNLNGFILFPIKEGSLVQQVGKPVPDSFIKALHFHP